MIKKLLQTIEKKSLVLVTPLAFCLLTSVAGSAGAQSTCTLPYSGQSYPGGITLCEISTGFNGIIGIDHHPTTNKVLISSNYPSGNPSNFELIDENGVHTAFAPTIAGLTDEIKIATVKSNYKDFVLGESFTGNGVSGQIIRISPDGSTVQNPWVSLGDVGLMRGSFYVDSTPTRVWDGDLLVVTTYGYVFRIKSNGVATLVAYFPGQHLEGLLAVPDDQAKYGPWAGKMLIGAENQGEIIAVATDGSYQKYYLGIAPEDIDLIPANQNFFAVNYANGKLIGAGPDQFASMVGDILVTQEFGALYRVRWNGSAFEKTLLYTINQFEHVTFSTAGIGHIDPTDENHPPVLTITSPLTGAIFPAGQTINLTSTFTDVDTSDTHVCNVTWRTGGTAVSGVVSESGGNGSCTSSTTPTAAGVYTVEVTVTDNRGLSDTETTTIIVYDPNAGFVTGGGWINSPAGAYRNDISLVGKANFGFVSKYLKGANIPTGETEFQFKAGSLNFHSSSYEWLVVSGCKAQYKGKGTVNGVAGYEFLLTATDSDLCGGAKTADKFRIKIWLSGGGIVYDNKYGASDDLSTDPQEIAGGSIVIHK